MKVIFWGVRGSIPAPLSNNQIRSRISAIIQRITPEDLQSQKTREKFLSRLPSYLFGTVGGNTTCIEVRIDKNTCVIIDAGTGIRGLGMSPSIKNIKDFHIFITHFHWDHIQGIPFFTPAYRPDNNVTFYSPTKYFEKYIREQMRYPYFPVEMDIMSAKIKFHQLDESELQLNDSIITWKKMKHPGGSFAYKIANKEKSIIIATDSEITDAEFQKTDENISFFNDTDLVVLDSQYTLKESFAKIDWGHSSYSIAVELAAAWNITKLVLFHHEPVNNDKKVVGIMRSAKWYLNHLETSNVDIYVANEGMEIDV